MRNKKSSLCSIMSFLVEWNKVMNLTGITDFEEVLLKTFCRQPFYCKRLDMTKILPVLMWEQALDFREFL